MVRKPQTLAGAHVKSDRAILVYISTGSPRPLDSPGLHRQVFDILHWLLLWNLGHYKAFLIRALIWILTSTNGSRLDCTQGDRAHKISFQNTCLARCSPPRLKSWFNRSFATFQRAYLTFDVRITKSKQQWLSEYTGSLRFDWWTHRTWGTAV